MITLIAAVILLSFSILLHTVFQSFDGLERIVGPWRIRLEALADDLLQLLLLLKAEQSKHSLVKFVFQFL